jgi:Tfp pilus assembly protein FimT
LLFVQAVAALLEFMAAPSLSFVSQAKQALSQSSSSLNLYSHLPTGTETFPSQ